jgi:hypothetical protein
MQTMADGLCSEVEPRLDLFIEMIFSNFSLKYKKKTHTLLIYDATVASDIIRGWKREKNNVSNIKSRLHNCIELFKTCFFSFTSFFESIISVQNVSVYWEHNWS